MIHLTKKEIMKFVSFESLDAAALELAGKVNTHLLECPECRKRVIAYQKMNDLLKAPGSRKEIMEMEKETKREADMEMDR